LLALSILTTDPLQLLLGFSILIHLMMAATKTSWLMLFGETVTVYCENHTEHTSVRISQETYYVSAIKTSWLMLFGETVAVYCENHTEHTDTACTSQETHYISATKTSLLMMFRETVTVYCENHTEHTYSPYLTGNTLSPLQRPAG
jgi:thioredoxin-related protein